MAGGINIRTEIKENTQEEKIILDVSSMELNEIALSYSSHHTITHLNLDYNNISNFPGDLVSCVPCLVYLTANGNNLIELPENFGSLKYLKEVYFCENALVRLPNSVQNLRNLKIMKLTGNKLSCLPDDFGEMENLAMLGIEENRLTKFPPTFALLSHLHTLEASNNKLQVLPRYLGSMCSLMHLNFADNQLEEIPESFSKLKELVCIDISRNKLRKLPKSCSSISTLKKFYAGMNVIEQFPEWLGHLPELQELCMKENMLTGVCLPDDMGKVCKQLQFLDLSGNQLTKLPESFGELEHLQIVHFGSKLDELERKEWTNGNLLTKLPASFAQLCNLTRLRLDENQLQFLPEDFGSLANLEFLNLGQNLLYDLPESFGHLSKLQVCLLSRNNIQLLPSSFGFLQALEDLHLDNNLLAELPESFKQLQQLKVLDLFHNLLTEIPDCLPYLKNLQFLDLDQNPLKIAKKYIPKLVRNNSYAPRDPKLKGTWRGRFRDRIEEFVQIENKAETVGTHSVDEVEYENDNCVDVLHGIEDEPYSLNVLRRAAECNLWRKSTWHSHSGPARRPVFVRQRHVVVPMSSPPEDCDLQEEDYERTEENNWHDKECAEPEDTIDCENEEENWDVPAPEYKTHSGHLEQTDEDWVSHSVEDSKNSTPTYEQESRGNMESQLPSLEENWDDDPNDANSYSATDFHGLHNESNFSYNPKLIGFFFLPSDMHAKPIPHSHLTTKNINKLNSPAYAENQFSDAEDS